MVFFDNLFWRSIKFINFFSAWNCYLGEWSCLHTGGDPRDFRRSGQGRERAAEHPRVPEKQPGGKPGAGGRGCNRLHEVPGAQEVSMYFVMLWCVGAARWFPLFWLLGKLVGLPCYHQVCCTDCAHNEIVALRRGTLWLWSLQFIPLISSQGPHLLFQLLSNPKAQWLCMPAVLLYNSGDLLTIKCSQKSKYICNTFLKVFIWSCCLL